MMRRMHSVWRLIPTEGGSTVEGYIEFQPGLTWLGAAMGATIMRAMMSRQLGRSLQGLKQHLERVPAGG